jgi:hypothetical protein
MLNSPTDDQGHDIQHPVVIAKRSITTIVVIAARTVTPGLEIYTPGQKSHCLAFTVDHHSALAKTGDNALHLIAHNHLISNKLPIQHRYPGIAIESVEPKRFLTTLS